MFRRQGARVVNILTHEQERFIGRSNRLWPCTCNITRRMRLHLAMAKNEGRARRISQHHFPRVTFCCRCHEARLTHCTRIAPLTHRPGHCACWGNNGHDLVMDSWSVAGSSSARSGFRTPVADNKAWITADASESRPQRAKDREFTAHDSTTDSQRKGPKDKTCINVMQYDTRVWSLDAIKPSLGRLRDMAKPVFGVRRRGIDQTRHLSHERTGRASVLSLVFAPHAVYAVKYGVVVISVRPP